MVAADAHNNGVHPGSTSRLRVKWDEADVWLDLDECASIPSGQIERLAAWLGDETEEYIEQWNSSIVELDKAIPCDMSW